MQIFTDPELTNQITELSLGIVDAGTVKSYTFYLYNDTDAQLVDIVISCNHPEVKVVRAPETLEAKSSIAFEISWAPEVTVKQGLHTEISVAAHELWSN